ncbi:Cupin 2 conserved barrel [Penicillium riverlandense]|uniref:Cupin 2 conserved barrel n=1 Tax=Penicillium riverlandense TaxID=1903569 RepID=UPI002546EAF8|nr:Cupin 2 conserved barrel [Penicillium riverlandense]KAJ5807940.1 Cupin 2 conserved barrel [Penicillium riverlandense]
MAANPSEISPLRSFTHYITGHDAEGKALIHSSTPSQWQTFEGAATAFDLIYTTGQFPVNLNGDADIRAHEQLIQSGQLGPVNPNGTVCRVVDFGPHNLFLMHRTQSLDYGVVLEGEMEMLVDVGDPVLMKRGDVIVQRATLHGWRNPSETEWARMFFVLQECQPVTIGGKELKEDLGFAAEEGIINSSRNDQ